MWPHCTDGDVRAQGAQRIWPVSTDGTCEFVMAILGQGKFLSSSPGMRTRNWHSTICDLVQFPALFLPPYQLCRPAPTVRQGSMGR